MTKHSQKEQYLQQNKTIIRVQEIIKSNRNRTTMNNTSNSTTTNMKV